MLNLVTILEDINDKSKHLHKENICTYTPKDGWSVGGRERTEDRENKK